MNARFTPEWAGHVLQLANSDAWHEPAIKTRASLKLAVDALRQQRANFWELPPEKLSELLRQGYNARLRRLLNRHDDLAIAFAIRRARM